MVIKISRIAKPKDSPTQKEKNANCDALKRNGSWLLKYLTISFNIRNAITRNNNIRNRDTNVLCDNKILTDTNTLSIRNTVKLTPKYDDIKIKK